MDGEKQAVHHSIFKDNDREVNPMVDNVLSKAFVNEFIVFTYLAEVTR